MAKNKGILEIRAKIVRENKFGVDVVIATYQCPDPECGRDHIIGTIASEMLRFPGIKDAWEKVVFDVIGSIGAEIAEQNGGTVVSKSVVKVSDMN